jgi:hypothetical protein
MHGRHGACHLASKLKGGSLPVCLLYPAVLAFLQLLLSSFTFAVIPALLCALPAHFPSAAFGLAVLAALLCAGILAGGLNANPISGFLLAASSQTWSLEPFCALTQGAFELLRAVLKLPGAGMREVILSRRPLLLFLLLQASAVLLQPAPSASLRALLSATRVSCLAFCRAVPRFFRNCMYACMHVCMYVCMYCGLQNA